MRRLFQTVRDVLMELLADPKHLGAEPGFLLALHTWGRSLSLHPHIHCLITDGGLADGQWCSPKGSCFLPARVVMAKFRGKFLWAIRHAQEQDEIVLPEGVSPERFRRAPASLAAPSGTFISANATATARASCSTWPAMCAAARCAAGN